MRITRVLHVSVNVAEGLDEASSFYRDRLGLRGTWRPEVEGVAGTWFSVGDLQLHLVGGALRPDSIDPGAHHVCFGVDDLDAAVAELDAAGIAHLDGTQDHQGHVVRQVWITDPQGNVVELQQDPEPLVAALLAAGSATLGESGAAPMHPRIRPAWLGAAVAGPAFPVRCTPGDNLAIHVGVTRAPAGSVMVADMGGTRELGYWGEVLTTAAKSRHIAGLVIDGCVRDIAALEAHRFPVFSTGTALSGATKSASGATGVTVEVGDRTVQPGDWIVGDVDGTVVIPADALGSVLAAARTRTAKEADAFSRLRAGATTVELLDLDPTLVDDGDRPSAKR